MGFNFSNFIKSAFTPLKSESDFRVAHSLEIQKFNYRIVNLSGFYIEDDVHGWGWHFDNTPEKHKEKFENAYKKAVDFIENTVRPFLVENSQGYDKIAVLKIADDMLEKAKDTKNEFYRMFPYIEQDYKEYLKKEAIYANNIYEKLISCQPVKQKQFLDTFEDRFQVQKFIDKAVAAGKIERVKQGRAYVISLVNKEAQ